MHTLLTLLALLTLTACGTGIEARKETAQRLLGTQLSATTLHTTSFPLYAALPYRQATEPLTIVIEGDGYAFVSRSRLSGDPTPKNPAGLKLASALNAQGQSAAYLARPCQYVRSSRCSGRYWSVDRYAPEALSALNEAVTQIKARMGAPDTAKLHLIGYSGGGYVALNLAAMRDDVAQVTSVAGLLSPHDWTDYHGVTPLNITRSAQDLFTATHNTAFTHYCGEQDKIIPCAFQHSVLQRYKPAAAYHRLIRVLGAKHSNVWESYIKT